MGVSFCISFAAEPGAVSTSLFARRPFPGGPGGPAEGPQQRRLDRQCGKLDVAAAAAAAAAAAQEQGNEIYICCCYCFLCLLCLLAAELLLHLASPPIVAASAVVAAVSAFVPPSSSRCCWDSIVWLLLQHCSSSIRDVLLSGLFAAAWPPWAETLIAALGKAARWRPNRGPQ